MTLTAGTRFGPYEILALLGSGGMGQVYRARDTRLDRIVAVKVLPPAFAADPQSRERFAREARSLSALNHPNICAVYDVGEEADRGPAGTATQFLVMEHLEGETLAARLAAGPIPLADALRIAAEIAAALDAAHRHGIVHRDLKPGNVFLVRRSSSSVLPTAKLLDFGLAKLVSAANASDPGTVMPTATAPITARGTILGTFQYMAPEQIEGGEADARTDIFAFGALLYELVAGRPAFQGKSQASLIGAILKDDPPPVSETQPVAPLSLDYLVKSCLAKDPDARFQNAHDVLLQLTWIADAGGAGAVHEPARSGHGWRGMAAAAGLALAIAGGIAYWLRTLPPTDEPSVTTRFRYSLLEGQTFARTGRRVVAISPDGTRIVHAAGQYLYLRAVDRMDAEPIPGTNEDPMEPVFSPDGAWLAYFAGGRTLRKVAISGGAPVTLAELDGSASGADWRDGAIVFAVNSPGGSGIFTVPDGGGEPRPLVRVDPAVERVSQPQMLADGKHLLFTVSAPQTTMPGEGTIVVQSLETGVRTVLVKGGTSARVLPTGHLVYFHDASLFGFPFNPRTLEFSSAPVLLVEGVFRSGGGQFAVSANGTLVYQPIAPQPVRRLVWVDRQGREQELPVASGDYLDPRISPDGTQLAVSLATDIWISPLDKPVFRRLTFTTTPEYNPIWLPNGKQVIFDSRTADGRIQIAGKSADGTGGLDVVVPPPGGYPDTVSGDAAFLVYHTAAENAVSMLWPLTGAGQPRPLIRSAATLTLNAEISPEGHWIAYQSNESGRLEIYVHPFPATETGRWQVSFSGGSYPAWARSGRELFFISGDGTLASVPVPAGPSFTPGAAAPLFQAGHYYVDAARNYDVARDATRFLFVKNVTSGNRPAVGVVSNWFREVREKMAGNALRQ